jgi:putative endonuclease
MKGGWVYIVTNRPNGTLYIGVTSNLARRIWEHREGLVEGFTKRYGLKRLVYVERYDEIGAAIQRETNLKHWPRSWKVNLILTNNPHWDDLYDQIMCEVSPTGTRVRAEATSSCVSGRPVTALG